MQDLLAVDPHAAISKLAAIVIWDPALLNNDSHSPGLPVVVKIDHFANIPAAVAKTELSQFAPDHSYGMGFNLTLDLFCRSHS